MVLILYNNYHLSSHQTAQARGGMTGGKTVDVKCDISQIKKNGGALCFRIKQSVNLGSSLHNFNFLVTSQIRK
jgi:hypothetical protein